MGREIFGEVIENLCPQVTGGFAPAAGQLRLHGVTDVLAIGDGRVAEQLPFGAKKRLAIASVRPGLFATDKEFRGSINIIGSGTLSGERRHLGRLGQGLSWLAIGLQPFPAAFAAKSTFARAAKPGCSVKQIGRIDPDHTGHELRGDFQRKIDVFGPERRCQTVFAVVGNLHGLCRGAEGG